MGTGTKFAPHSGMIEATTKPKPWLIAAWPGMGSVAVIAAGYLVNQLGMKRIGVLAPRGHFDIAEVEIKDGLIAPTHLPRGLLFKWENPGPGRDLLVFLGEAQPAVGLWPYAHELIEAAAGMNVERVVTFASIASGLHPTDYPRVAGVATDSGTMTELRRAEVTPLGAGQVGGLNGVVLAAAREHAMTGVCLLAEIPAFAVAVPNPKAARAALSVFSVLAGVDFSLQALNTQAAAMERTMIEAMERIERQRNGEGEEEFNAADEEGEESDDEAVEPEAEADDSALDIAAESRIERLFEEAQHEPRKADLLKQELDRLGAFEKYEDRFLDLFRRAN